MVTGASRREFLGVGVAALAAGSRALAAPDGQTGGFRFCLNTATLQGYRLGIAEEVEIAGKAGYQAIEPWLREVTTYVQRGGSLAELRRRIAGAGLTVESAIAFPEWIVDDSQRRAAALEQVKRDMDTVAQIGGTRIAAPPAGANTAAPIPLIQMAERYRAVLELGDRAGMVPELEFWGSSTNLHTLPEAVFVAMQTGHPKACVLADVFHLYKGGSGFGGLRMLSAAALQVIHMNDYPANPPRESVADRDRVYPGDGIAPMKQIVPDLRRVNPQLVLSLEVFNASYWKGDPLDTAKTGLAKMKQAAASAAA